MPKRDDLLPCPFCGKTPTVVYQYGFRYLPESTSPLWAVDHICTPGHGDTVEEAVAKWNRRAAPAA